MAIGRQLVPVAFSAPNQRNPHPLSPPGTLTLAENVRVDKGGASGLRYRKRPGTGRLGKTIAGSASEVTTGRALYTYRDELLLRSLDKLYSRLPTSDRWTPKGEPGALSITTRPIVADAVRDNVDCDVAYAGGVSVYAYYRPGGGVRMTVVDQASGTITLSDEVLDASGSLPRCAALNSNTVCAFWVSAANDLKVVTIASSSPWTYTTSTIAAISANGVYDVIGLGSIIGIAYASAAFTLTCRTWNGVSAGAASSLACAGTLSALSWYRATSYGATLKLAACLSTGLPGVYQYSVTNSGMVPSAQTQLEAGSFDSVCACEGGSDAGVFYTQVTSGVPTVRVYRASASVFRRGVRLASVPFNVGSKWNLWLSYQSSTFGSSMVIQDAFYLSTASGDIVGRCMTGTNQGGGHRTFVKQVPNVAAVDSDTFLVAMTRRTRLSSSDFEGIPYTTPVGVNSVLIDYDSAEVVGSAELGGVLVMPGGLVSQYDGVRTREAGFHHAPEKPSCVAGSGGSLTASSTYQCVATFEEIDAAGNVHRSGVSESVTVTLSSTQNRITWTVPTYRLCPSTGRTVNIVLWRTLANGSEWRRVVSAANGPSNDPTLDTVTFVDDIADTTIADNELLYTDDGILDHYEPPTSKICQAVGQRVWLAGCENPDELWPSLERDPDIGLAWSPTLVLRLKPQDGAPTRIMELDGRPIVFTPRAVYVIEGDGLGNDASGSQFVLRRLPGDVGLPTGAPAFSSADGVRFRSAEGWKLLDRGLSVQDAGSGVDGYGSLTIAGAAAVPNTHTVRFASREGTTLVWDTLYGVWTVDTGQAARGCALWGGVWHWVASDGAVYYETPGFYSDYPGVAFTSKLRLAPLVFSALGGFQRCWSFDVLGERLGDTTLSIRALYEYDLGSLDKTKTRPITSADTYRRRFNVRPDVQRFSALTLEFSEATTTAGWAIEGLSFDCGFDGRRAQTPHRAG